MTFAFSSSETGNPHIFVANSDGGAKRGGINGRQRCSGHRCDSRIGCGQRGGDHAAVRRDAGHGPTLIISPLLALMRNQIDMAGRLGLRWAGGDPNVFDWRTQDVWKAIYENDWRYNVIYDKQYQFGTPLRSMRVSSFSHSQAYGSLNFLREAEPETYDAAVCTVPNDVFAGLLSPRLADAIRSSVSARPVSTVSSTAACSVASVTMRRRFSGSRDSVPFSAQLIASVAPDVK